MSANVVLGQADFAHKSSNRGGSVPGANTIYSPNCVSVDNSGNVWVADTSNNRVIKYNTDFIPTYSISGYVLDNSSQGISGVTVLLSGSSTEAYTTAANGYYTFASLSSGTYTVNPNKTDWAFNPSSPIATIVNSNHVVPNSFGRYTGVTPLYNISGYVKDSSSAGISGVTVNLTGPENSNCVTGVTGLYSFTNLSAGTYTVNPNKNDWAFNPSNPTVVITNSNQIAQNSFGRFVGVISTYSISGYVLDNSSQGISGVTVLLSGSSTEAYTTAANGYYTFASLSSGTYTVNPNKTDWIFNPSSPIVIITNTNQTVQPSFGTHIVIVPPSIMYSISGDVRDSNGIGINGVTVTLSGASNATMTTGDDGFYTFTGLSTGTYNITLTKIGYTFTPAEINVTLSGADLTGEDFTGVLEEKIKYTSLAQTKFGPNPCVINRTGGGAGGASVSAMKFTKLPSNSQVMIYTISGKLVKVLNESNTEISFNGKNTAGDVISQGVYLYVIKTPDGLRKTGKIAVKVE
ncbi:MAG: hypothetical protein A3J83_06135 [Elusimicrobia bacterium RIFOXYA2_FULL_40_6]|nr:MAG: hypothetical protein A3J83_06135 [Elusimicrobia bacterium RIFOXYA2_FULL_40_6]